MFKLADGSPARPFTSNEEMDYTMMENWNKLVRPQDHVYHLGDFTMLRQDTNGRMTAFRQRLNGHLRILLGNHDALPSKWYFQNFEKVYGSRVIDNLLMTHIPVNSQSLGRFKANVHGHTHHNKIMLDPHHPDSRYINVSVEQTNYSPVAWEDLKKGVKE